MVDIVTKPDLDSQIAGRAPLVHTHVKGDVGLGNVDNTSDVNKPVSTAQAAAMTTFGRDRGAGTTNPSTDLRRGDTFFRTDLSALMIYTGSAWIFSAPRLGVSYINSGAYTQELKIAAGDSNAVFSNISYTYVNIDYTSAGFTSPPVITGCAADAGVFGPLTFHSGTGTQRTATNATLTIRTAQVVNINATVVISWMAVGK